MVKNTGNTALKNVLFAKQSSHSGKAWEDMGNMTKNYTTLIRQMHEDYLWLL